jgi:hypothetical protein
MSHSVKTILAVVVLLALAACARPSEFVLGPPDLVGLDLARGPAPSYRNAISVAPVSVGADTGLPWRGHIGPPEVQDALARTLAATGLAAAGLAASNGRFRLDTTLLTLERPYAGWAMTVTANIAYRLTEVASGRVVYNNTISTPGTASLNDAITNEARLKIADQRAITANLRRLVDELYALPEPTPPTSSRPSSRRT